MFSNSLRIKSLGSLLQQANLVSASQIEEALQEQIESNNIRIGKILASRGWIKQETADFFAEQWNSLLSHESKLPLGHYLKEAALLNEEQIKVILLQQKHQRLELRFGTLAVLNGWLKPTTIEFFLNCFYPERPSRLRENYSLDGWSSDDKYSHPLEAMREELLRNQQCDSTHLLNLYQKILLEGEVIFNGSNEQAKLIGLGLVVKDQNKLKVVNKIYRAVFNPCWVDQQLTDLDIYNKIKLKFLRLNEKASLPYRVLTEILAWTGNQPFLVQKLVQILHQSELFIPAGEEAPRIAELVQTHFIENWETQVAADHLKEIRDSFVHNDQCKFPLLARVYQKILLKEKVSPDDFQQETALINLGLVVKEEEQLKVANRIYQKVFNSNWLANELATMVHPSLELKATTTHIEEEEESVVPLFVKDMAKMMWASPSAITNTTDIEPQPILSIKATRIDHDTDNEDKKKNNKSIIVALMLLGASLFSLKFFSQSRQAKIFQEGNELFVQGIYQEAIIKYNQLLKINANYYQAWTNRGYAFAGLKEYQKMLDSCTSATIIETQAVYGWNCQGEALYNLQQYDKAIAAFDKAIALEPKNALFWINKAESLLALKENDQALKVIDEAIKLLDSGKKAQEEEKNQELSVAFTHQGKALWQKKEYERALVAYDQALKYVPDYFTAQRDRSIILRKLKRSDEAVINFNQILNSQKLSSAQKAEIWYYLGLSFIDLSRNQEAISAFDEALNLKPDYQAAIKAQKTILRRAD